MTIEFRKVPLVESNFEISLDSAKFSGTFCKISPKIAKIVAKMTGELAVDCCKCGKTFPIDLNEDTTLLVSDGVYKSTEDDEFIVVEVDDSIIDFQEIFQSELESLKSEYYVCNTCNDSTDSIDIEY